MSLLPAFEKMPIWPAAGSVQVVDGVILVRLGKRPGTPHMQIMKGLEPKP